MARLREELTNKGFNLPPEKEKGEHFDSNCITPVSQCFYEKESFGEKVKKKHTDLFVEYYLTSLYTYQFLIKQNIY